MAKLTTKKEIKNKLESIKVKALNGLPFSENDQAWLTKSLLAIYEYQTTDEKLAQATTEHNCVGFNGVDATILSSIAEQWKSREWLSTKQLVIIAKKMPKYAGQLEKIAAEKMARSTVVATVSESTMDETNAVEFPNGATINFDLLTPVFYGGQLIEWRTSIDGQEYVLKND